MSSRITFGAMLNTVQSTANTLTATLDAANTSVGMLTSFVTAAADNQRIRQIADKETFLEELIQEKAVETTKSAIKVEKFIAQSVEHKKHFGSAYETFTKLLRDKKED